MAAPSVIRPNGIISTTSQSDRIPAGVKGPATSAAGFSAAKESRQRLYPSIGNPHYLVLAKRREIFSEWLNDIKGKDLSILDVGGRVQPYRPLLDGRISAYVALDPVVTEMVDLVGTGENVPVASDVFDIVFCTQVLQLVTDPAMVLSEIHRVLKQGGALLLSVPSSSPRFADSDAWRFLPSGIRTLLAGFSRITIVPEGNTISGFFRTINAYMYIFARRPSLIKLLGFTVFPALNLAGLMLDRLSRRNDSYAVNYSVLAIK